jgi:hypothetical protein
MRVAVLDEVVHRINEASQRRTPGFGAPAGVWRAGAVL